MYSKTVMIGTVCSEVKSKTIDSGVLVADFRLQTDDKHTQYHTINCYDKTAHSAKDFVQGDIVFVEGKVNTRSYKDKNNEKKYITTINAARVAPIGKSIEGDQSENQTQIDEDIF